MVCAFGPGPIKNGGPNTEKKKTTVRTQTNQAEALMIGKGISCPFGCKFEPVFRCV